MPAIPLPFLVSGALLLVALRLMTRSRRDRLFLIFVCACAFQTMLVGLNCGLYEDRLAYMSFLACDKSYIVTKQQPNNKNYLPQALCQIVLFCCGSRECFG